MLYLTETFFSPFLNVRCNHQFVKCNALFVYWHETNYRSPLYFVILWLNKIKIKYVKSPSLFSPGSFITNDDSLRPSATSLFSHQLERYFNFKCQMQVGIPNWQIEKLRSPTLRWSDVEKKSLFQSILVYFC